MDSLATLLNNNLDVSNLTSVQNTISTIEKYMNNLSSQVEESINTQYSDVAATMSQTDALHQKSKQFISEFQLLNSQISKDLEVEVVSTEDTQKALMNRMLKSESMISTLHQLCQCHEMIEAASDSSNLLEEAEKLKVAELKLKALCNLTQSPSVVVDMKERIQDRLLEIFKSVTDWSSIVSIQNRNVSFSEGAIILLDEKVMVLEVIAKSEINTISELMASNILKEIVLPTITENQKIVLKNSSVSLADSSGSKVEGLSEITTFFTKVSERFLPSNQQFRRNFWENILEELLPEVKTFIKSEIPVRISDLNSFADAFIPALEKFEGSIKELNENVGNHLSAYVSSYHLLFAQKYKENCYSKARKILMTKSKDSVSVLKVLAKPVEHPVITPPRDPCSPLTLQFPQTNNALRLPEFPVSNKTVDLANLIKDILREATSKDLSQEACGCLCVTGKNIAEMFLVPSFDPFDVAEEPERAARFFCDCWYLSHIVFWESVELKQQLPNENFFDVISYLRCSGAATLKNNSDALHGKVKSLIKQIGGLDGQGKENHGLVIEMAFVQTVALINKYVGCWKKNLPKDKYLHLLQSTIDMTLNLLLSDILTIQDISAKHSTCLCNNFNLLLDQLTKVRSDNLAEDSESWTRFKLVIGLLDDGLVKIVEDWENGKLSKHFKSSEIQHLVKALFQNTEKNVALRRRITGDIL
ncbi:hypothetical protein ACHWQZ_G006609 [Mnemiopsis leidyi]